MKFQIELVCNELVNAKLTYSNCEVTANNARQWELELINDTVITINLPGISISQPLLRVNGFLLNFWLANVKFDNNQLVFTLGPNFSKGYSQRNLQGKLDSINNTTDKTVLDRLIGRSLHLDLVNNLHTLINEKRNLN